MATEILTSVDSFYRPHFLQSECVSRIFESITLIARLLPMNKIW